MTEQRLISDAKRRARQNSRIDGRSYQNHLDEIARAVGHSDWAAFLKEPRALPCDKDVEAPAEEAVVEAEADPEREPTRSWWRRKRVRVHRDWIEWVRIVPGTYDKLMFLAFVPFTLWITAIIYLATRSIPFSDRSMDISACIVAGCMTGMLSVWATKSILASVVLTLTRKRDGYEGGPWPLVRMWMRFGIRMAAILAFPYFLQNWGTLLFSSPSTEAIESLQADQANTRYIRVVEMKGSRAVSTIRPGPDGHTIGLGFVIIDWRLTSKVGLLLSRPATASADPFRKALWSSIQKHPVVRLDGTMECGTGAYVARQMQTADSNGGPSILTHVFHRKKDSVVYHVDPADARMLCASVQKGGTPAAPLSATTA